MLSISFSAAIFVGIIFLIITFLFLNRKSGRFERFFNYQSYWGCYFPVELINPKEATEHNRIKEKEIKDETSRYPHAMTHLYYGSKVNSEAPEIKEHEFNDGYSTYNKNNQIVKVNSYFVDTV